MAKKKSNRKAKKEARKQQRRNDKYKDIAFKAVIVLVVIGLAGWIWTVASQPAYTPDAIGPSVGNENSDVTFLMFGCYTCPFTQQFAQNVLPTIVSEYEDRVNFVFRVVPISRNTGSHLAAAAAKCADRQDNFWEYSQALYNVGAFNEGNMLNLAENQGMDIQAFQECLNDDEIRQQVSEDNSAARRASITLTPTVYVNDVRLHGAFEVGLYRRVLDDMLAETTEQ